MSEPFSNVYQDQQRASSYAKLEYPGTYYLAFRDLPDLIRAHVSAGEPANGGNALAALDFGCGAGRSTRFLAEVGFEKVVGVDISAEMIEHAQHADPGGDYRLIGDGDLSGLGNQSFGLIQAAFTFDNIPTAAHKISLLRSLAEHLTANGKILVLVSAPEIYVNEWASFTTCDFPQNRSAVSGDKVQIIMLDVDDRRPVQDIVCSDADYLDIFHAAGLAVVEKHSPLGTADDPCSWVSETTISPWAIYFLQAEANR